MKKLLSFIVTTSLLLTNVIMLVACSNTKLNQSGDEEGLTEQDNLKEEINEEISKNIITPSENSDDGQGYVVKSYKDIDYKSFDEVKADIKDQTVIENKNFKNKLIDHIIKPKLSGISQDLKQKYDVFREQEDIIQLDENITIKKETIQFEEIFKLIKDENGVTNNDLATTPAEELGLVYKFSVSFSTKYKINNDDVQIQHTLTFYIANDVSKFTSMQDFLTMYVKNKITNFFKDLVYQNFPNNKISDDINQLISTFTNKKYTPAYIQNIFKASSPEITNSPFKITGSAILSSDTKKVTSILERISNYNANLNDIFNILASEDPGQLNKYLKDTYQNYLDKQVFIEKKSSYEALKFSLDLMSSEIYGYHLKSIFIKDLKVNVNYDKLVSKVKSDIDKISTAIRLLFLNSNSKFEKINRSKDIDRSFSSSRNQLWYRWTLKMLNNKPIWDASDCFVGEKHCLSWDNTGKPKSRNINLDTYLVGLINKDILDKWFIKDKLHNDAEFKMLYNNFNTNFLAPKYCCWRYQDWNYDVVDKPIDYGTNIKNRIHLYQLKSNNPQHAWYQKEAYIWNFNLDNISIKGTFSWEYETNFLVLQK